MIVFRRRILIAGLHPAEGTARVRAALEDDFHHFRVEVRSAGGVVTAVIGEAIRFPYTMCPSAAEPLRQLEGMALSSVANAVTRRADASGQCTHLFDLAGLAIAAAARRLQRREYRIEVPMRSGDRTQPKLWRDGVLALQWQVNGPVIEGPLPYDHVNLREGLARWALTHLSEDDAEAALVLRRATAISIGRTKRLDDQVHASSTGFCFSQQPVRAQAALRVVGSTWDFTAGGEALCGADLAWLAFDPGPSMVRA
jgi:Protein of unknown function (DUF2889)